MYSEPLVTEWLEKYDNVTSFSFMVFFKLTEEEMMLLSKGLTVRLLFLSKNGEFALVHDEVDEELAKALGTYQGINLCFIFPGDYSDLEDMVQSTVLEGLEFLRLKGEYLGMAKVKDNV